MARGRKSAAGQAIVAPLDAANVEKGRIKPPDGTDPEISRMFSNIVAGRPAFWFGYQDIDFLMIYCQAAVQARMLHDRIMVASKTKKGESLELRRLILAHDRVAKTMATMASKMRLTQSATIKKVTTERILKEASPGEQDTKSGGVRAIWERKTA